MTLRFAALFIALGLAACSGGGSTATPPAVATNPQSAARGTMTLKVNYSALHHVASAKRSPKFVDGLGATLDVSATANNVGGFNDQTFTVAPAADGSQTISISAFATNSGIVNIRELDASNNVLAAGTATYSLAAGATGTAAITLDMAPSGIYIAESLTPLSIDAVLASDVVNNEGIFTAPSGGPPLAPSVSCTSTFFIAATDAIGGFQNTAGAISGVTPAVTIASQTGGSTLTAGPFPGEFTRSSNEPETVQFLVTSSSNQSFANYTVSVSFPDCT